MKELIARLKAHPFVTAQLLGATLFINLLAFASPVFVMLILGQYVETGFSGTLVTLSLGMLLALLMQVGFNQARILMASQISTERDEDISRAMFDVLTRAKAQALEHIPTATRRQFPSHVQTIRNAYAPDAVGAVLDAPFLPLFIIGAFFLSPALAWVGILGTAATIVMGLAAINKTTNIAETAQAESMQAKGVAAMTYDGAETVRSFGLVPMLLSLWDKHSTNARQQANILTRVRACVAADAQGMASLCRIAVYSIGAYQCVIGELNFAALIAVNILIGRALKQATLFANADRRMSRASRSLATLQELARLPLEASQGTALNNYSGRLSFKDVSFAHPGGTGPLFESMNLTLQPGSLTVVFGKNGSGKTTLARLIAGLVGPIRGEILADGITLRQMAPAWWRSQLTYFPQEPEFLSGTIAENIAMGSPDADANRIDAAIQAAGLSQWLCTQEHGLDTPLSPGTLSLGIRRRLALARALTVGGKLALFDDPFEGLDTFGAKAVASAISRLRKNGATIIVFTHSRHPIPGADLLINLNAKPVPEIQALAGKEGPHGS